MHDGVFGQHHQAGRTLQSSGSPHSPSLYVIRTWLLVGRNSKPNSSHGTSILAVPGFPGGVSSLASADDEDVSRVADSLVEEHLGGLMNVYAPEDAHRAAETSSGSDFIVATDCLLAARGQKPRVE